MVCFVKIRSIAATLLFLKQAQKTKAVATDLQSFLYKNKPPTTESPSLNFNINLS
jgi:hypothetical protein